jgi:hypothetical protein
VSQFRTTADLLDLVLTNGGEVTNGNSAYEAQVLNYLNRVHFAIVAGGSIPIGKDSTIEIDEVWPWAKARSPLILELQPKYQTGTVLLTQGSEVGAFSSGPAASLEGWHIAVAGRAEWFKIVSHTAGATAFEIDGAYSDTTGAALSFTAVKLDYELIPEFLTIDASNNKLQFQEVALTTLTATLTSGVYSPSALATEVATQLNTTGGTPVYTVTYSAITRKFTIASDRGGASIFILVGTGSQSAFSAHKLLGFDDEDSTNAASVVSTYVLGGIARLIEPFRVHKASGGSIFGIDSESFHRGYPLSQICEGVPDKFAVIREASDGTLTVRMNRYATEKTRIEVEHVAVPRDLKDSASSIPLLPRKHVDVLEDAATFYLMLAKSDDRAMTFSSLMQGKLKAMVTQHRGSLLRAGNHFGQLIARRDQMMKRRLFSGEPY